MTFAPKTYILNLWGQKSGGELLATKKMGRPTAEPKPHKVGARVSETDKRILDDYCLRNNVNQPEAIRIAIRSLKK